MRNLQHSTPAPDSAAETVRQPFAHVEGDLERPALVLQQRRRTDGSGWEVLAMSAEVDASGRWTIVGGWMPASSLSPFIPGD